MASLRLKTFTLREDLAGYGEPVTSPRTAGPAIHAIFQELDADREHFVVLALNPKGRPLGYKLIGSGSCTATIATPRDAFRAALTLGAVSVIVAHNHPTGDLTPSREDCNLTHRLREVGDALGVPLADHFIINASGDFHSFRMAEGWDR